MTMTYEWAYDLFNLSPPKDLLRDVPSWVDPGPVTPSGRDSYSIACAVVATAVHAAHDRHVGTQDAHYLGIAQRALSCGSHVVDGPAQLRAYIGLPLFAGLVAAETIRNACLDHAEAGRDGELLGLIGDSIDSLWQRHRGSIRITGPTDPQAGTALRRHAEILRYDQDVHPGLVLLGRTAACSTPLFSRHLRRLNQAVYDHHAHHYLHRAEDSSQSPLARAMTTLLAPAEHTDEAIGDHR
ncbi:hypothetical protein ACH4VR_40370 [Streptomyces sp. NPDC020883]|uniref:hypothetical protein n=1 Tax=Streptomyces sp. NPDC020883 TaxID=3365099 RepID=UPI0037A61146